MRPHLIFRLFLLCGLALSAFACASADAPAVQPAPAAPAAASSAKLWSAIQAEVGDAACNDAAQCQSIAVGAKACGGPDGYLAWSSKRSDAGRLQALVAQHAAARKQENLRDQTMSNCMFEPNPGASCQAARCTLRARGVVSPPGRAD